jgi:2-polyprenyl-3-methyl-5-hydroxy-6-metoxy-1,4-benzoquinol methylase
VPDNEWNQIYSKKGMASYPDNALVRFVAKQYYNATNRKDVKFLDIGCGGQFLVSFKGRFQCSCYR